MAASTINGLDMQLKDYFDHLAPSWDGEITSHSLECLANIVKELDIRHEDWVLDIGCGTGILLPFLTHRVTEKGKVIALDFSAKMLLQAKTKGVPSIVDFIQADITSIPLPQCCVDLAICNSVFPHFSDKARALMEIARVMGDDGRLVICHTKSREEINQLHQTIGGVVGDHSLPDELELTQLTGHACLTITHLEDNPWRYLVIARKNHR